MHRVLMALACLTAACGGSKSSGTPTSPSPTTSVVAVTVPSPLRMGQSAQAAGTETLSSGQMQSITSGWQSDAPAVATATGAGLVTGIANGRATIFVVAGGRQGQQVVRVVPDYQGLWRGDLLVTSCVESGVFVQIDFCDELSVGVTTDYAVSLSQSGENMMATVTYGSVAFPAVAAPVRDDGTSVFTASASMTESGITLTIDAGFTINSPRVGELTGTVSEVWRFPGFSGEGRLVQDIVLTSRTSSTPFRGVTDTAGKRLRLLRRLAQD